MARKSDPLVVAFSDLHVGSTVALCHPQGIALEDGGRYMPNPAQLWIWDRWIELWGIIKTEKKRRPVIGIMNGEFVDGKHHETSQLASASPEIMAGAALDVMSVVMPCLSMLYVTRGTEAHSGAGAASDYAIARELGAIVDPTSGMNAAYQWRIDVNGVIIDAAHHVSGGARLSSRGNGIRAEMIDSIVSGDAPDVMIRSHVHNYSDTGMNFWPRQAFVTPAWQLKTAFGHRITRVRTQNVGCVLVDIEDGQALPIRPILYSVPKAAPHIAVVK